MPYLVSSIIAVVSALVILFTRYEADDSAIKGELDRLQAMFSTIDGFVNTYVQSGGSLTDVNFEVLYDDGILLGNIEKGTGKNVDGTSFASTLTFPNSTVKWQLIPVRNITPSDNTDFGDSAGSAYKLLVDMTKNSTLMNKAIFSESFSGREFCEKMLLGTFQTDRKPNSSFTVDKEDFLSGGTNEDGYFVCIVFK